MARKTKEESQKTRDGILDAAERVFLEKGVGTTAMADLADAAGVSRGAVYGHYKNKIEVCLAMCDRAFGQIEVPDENARVPALDILLRAGMGFLRQCCEPGSVQRVLEILYLKCERSDENEPLLRRRELLEKQGQRFGLRQIRRAVERGELPARLDVELASIYLQSLWDGICGPSACATIPGTAPNACSAPASTACAVLPTCCWRTPEGVNRPPSGACAGPRRRRPPAAGRLPR
ncbi:hypothetical protein PALA6_02580 [Pseudomonas aeruginosa]|nr:hypothetical protein [Pseudomonas aeruginosa]WBH28478.1 hypothetical protein PALA2_02821 [Pseudomonas aeruginosa]WBH40101.1 hypothetical protein PALA6_02580 [Pseudomonas aeruginosa]